MGKSLKHNMKIKPFLRWAGGKQRVVKFLLDNIPLKDVENNFRYYEPFLGAGNLFFSLNLKKATLSDKNIDLIDCYKYIREDPTKIADLLENHNKRTSKNYYYEMRERYNDGIDNIEKAALFIYLNKTCFNGIWRVNKKGKFNVPYGYKEPPSLPSKKQLMNVATALQCANLYCRNYKYTVKYPKNGDFIYFDPPYPPLNDTSYFTQYTKEGFTLDDHYELAMIAKKLSKKGCFVMISNADIPKIRKMYCSNTFYFNELNVTRLISANGRRYSVKELIITNYKTKNKLEDY